MTDDRSFEELDREECLECLATRRVGRVAVVVDDGSPLVVPVNYAVDAETVVFRTGPGLKLAGLRTQPLSFQVDDHDPYRRTGWSVLIRGIAFEIEETDATEDPGPWVPGEKAHWVRVMPMEITGRRVLWSGPAVDARGYL
jgi:nitroimidazol reductase NimA-like FMN-containing flavoprotein (pyridoxamine 5'-phosphate oxidase superfamily)